jgi:predicted peptidase
MKSSVRVLATSLLGALVATSAEPEPREFAATDGTVVKYRWSAPEPIEPGKTYPLVLFLHGSGERGDDNSAQLKHGVGAIVAGTRKAGDPVFLIAPQCPEGRWWSAGKPGNRSLAEAGAADPLMDAILALVEQTTRQHPVDPKRFYVTGLSMGGFGTWDLLTRIPEKIAAAVPVCGGGDPATVTRFKDVPIWAFHGGADPVVPVSATQDMVSALEKAGGNPKVTIYPDVEHDSWTRTYEDPLVIRWILDQKRK